LSRAATASCLAAAALLTGCAGSADDARRPAVQYPPPGSWAPPAATWAPQQPASPQPPCQWGRASFYADRLAGHATATGEPYDPAALTAAHRTLPLGTFVDVARADGRHVVVRVNDRGPYAGGRIIDLSRRAAAEIGMIREGVADVALRVLWVPPSRPRRM
jgi:rare lipoprotein A